MTNPIFIVGFDDAGLAGLREGLPGGFPVLELPDADAALDALTSAVPSAVVVNFPQPLHDGRSLTAELRRHTRTAAVPIVAISEWNYRRTRATAARQGCTAFLAADAPASEIAGVLRRVLGREARRTAVQPSFTGSVAGSNVA